MSPGAELDDARPDDVAADDGVPDDVAAQLGQVQYEQSGGFPVERGYIWSTCAAVENGNPLFWDDEVAKQVTGGPIAPPTMVSVWFRPHHWAPGRTTQAGPGKSRPWSSTRKSFM